MSKYDSYLKQNLISAQTAFYPHKCELGELTEFLALLQDLADPLMVMFEQPEEDREGVEAENTFEVTEAIPDVELFEYKTSTRSIHVVSGA